MQGRGRKTASFRSTSHSLPQNSESSLQAPPPPPPQSQASAPPPPPQPPAPPPPLTPQHPLPMATPSSQQAPATQLPSSSSALPPVPPPSQNLHPKPSGQSRSKTKRSRSSSTLHQEHPSAQLPPPPPPPVPRQHQQRQSETPSSREGSDPRRGPSHDTGRRRGRPRSREEQLASTKTRIEALENQVQSMVGPVGRLWRQAAMAAAQVGAGPPPPQIPLSPTPSLESSPTRGASTRQGPSGSRRGANDDHPGVKRRSSSD